MDLTKIPFDQSPNYIKGRKSCKYLIIHAMSGTYIGTQSWFNNPKADASSHYLISQKGDVMQMVKDEDTAWHCYGLNSQALGIELEDGALGACKKSGKWITPALMESLINLTVALCKKHKISPANIYPHSAPWIRKIGGPKYAHEDPGPFFPWNLFIAKVREKL